MSAQPASWLVPQVSSGPSGTCPLHSRLGRRKATWAERVEALSHLFRISTPHGSRPHLHAGVRKGLTHKSAPRWSQTSCLHGCGHRPCPLPGCAPLWMGRRPTDHPERLKEQSLKPRDLRTGTPSSSEQSLRSLPTTPVRTHPVSRQSPSRNCFLPS